MLPMLWGILGFIITIGILVTIHEWGHFWVARRFDVKILRFSLGFGKPFLTWRGKKDGTLYTLAPIPLGGFVQMLGESSDEAVDAAEKHRTFQAKKAWQRFLIAFAGPAVNLLFAVLAFAALYLYGVQGLRPEVARVAPDSLAARAGLQVGDQIRAIEGKDTPLSSDAHISLVGAPRRSDVNIVIQRDGEERILALDLSSLRAGDELKMDEATGLYLVDEWLQRWVSKRATASPPLMAKHKTSFALAKLSQQESPAIPSALPLCARTANKPCMGSSARAQTKKAKHTASSASNGSGWTSPLTRALSATASGRRLATVGIKSSITSA